MDGTEDEAQLGCCEEHAQHTPRGRQASCTTLDDDALPSEGFGRDSPERHALTGPVLRLQVAL